MWLLESFAIFFYKVNCVFGQCINHSSKNNRRQFSKRFSQVLKLLKKVIKYFENHIHQIHLIKVLAFHYSLLLIYSYSTVCNRRENPESLGVNHCSTTSQKTRMTSMGDQLRQVNLTRLGSREFGENYKQAIYRWTSWVRVIGTEITHCTLKAQS